MIDVSVNEARCFPTFSLLTLIQSHQFGSMSFLVELKGLLTS